MHKLDLPNLTKHSRFELEFKKTWKIKDLKYKSLFAVQFSSRGDGNESRYAQTFITPDISAY